MEPIFLSDSLAKALKLPTPEKIRKYLPLTGIEVHKGEKKNTLYINSLKPTLLRQIRAEILQKDSQNGKVKESRKGIRLLENRIAELEIRVSALEGTNEVSKN